MGLRVSLGSYCPGGDGDDGSSNEKSTWMQANLPTAVLTVCKWARRALQNGSYA